MHVAAFFKEIINRSARSELLGEGGETAGYRYGKRKQAGNEAGTCMVDKPLPSCTSDAFLMLFGSGRREIPITQTDCARCRLTNENEPRLTGPSFIQDGLVTY